MGFTTDPITDRERAAAAAQKVRHEQGRCLQDSRLCHWCWMEAQEAKTGGPEYEAALKAYFKV